MSRMTGQVVDEEGVGLSSWHEGSTGYWISSDPAIAKITTPLFVTYTAGKWHSHDALRMLNAERGSVKR